MSRTKNGMLRRCLKGIADLTTPFDDNYQKWESKNRWLRSAGVDIHPQGVVIGEGFQCLTGLEERIHIDKYVAIGQNWHCWNFNEVTIGRFSMIAADVTFTNGGHDTSTFEPSSGPLEIGKGCWIGNGVRIVGPLTIGNNAIIAAGAIVVRDVPENSIVGGIPAKLIRMRELPKKVWHLGNIYFDPRTFDVTDD